MDIYGRDVPHAEREANKNVVEEAQQLGWSTVAKATF
jgi:hypothetical protein